MIFFLDENISEKAARLLETFDRENEVRAHKDAVAPGTSDCDWIHEITSWSPKPTVVSGDGRLLANPAELAALKKSQLHFVYLKKGWTNESWENFAWKLLKVWPSIVRNVRNARRPTVFEVGSGAVKVEQVKIFAAYKVR